MSFHCDFRREMWRCACRWRKAAPSCECLNAGPLRIDWKCWAIAEFLVQFLKRNTYFLNTASNVEAVSKNQGTYWEVFAFWCCAFELHWGWREEEAYCESLRWTLTLTRTLPSYMTEQRHVWRLPHRRGLQASSWDTPGDYFCVVLHIYVVCRIPTFTLWFSYFSMLKSFRWLLQLVLHGTACARSDFAVMR